MNVIHTCKKGATGRELGERRKHALWERSPGPSSIYPIDPIFQQNESLAHPDHKKGEGWQMATKQNDKERKTNKQQKSVSSQRLF